MATSRMRSRTLPCRGRNEARTRHARPARRRSRLAGCTWSSSNGVADVIAPPAIRASMDWQGRMPGTLKSLMGGEHLPQNGVVARLEERNHELHEIHEG